MSDLPIISGLECVKALEKVGFYRKRQKGSHVIICRDDPFCQVVIPNHKTLDRGTLRAIIRHTGMSVSQFCELI